MVLPEAGPVRTGWLYINITTYSPRNQPQPCTLSLQYGPPATCTMNKAQDESDVKAGETIGVIIIIIHSELGRPTVSGAIANGVPAET